MNTRDALRSALQSLVASMTVMVGLALAAEPPTTDHPVPSKETRQKMAALHEQMAACLRSDKPISECHAEMMKSCRDTLGEEGCPMMGHGMRPRHMMKDQSKDSQDQTHK